MIMENEISQFYTCITQISNTNKNEQIIKKYSLPTQLSSSSFISCDSGKENDQKENENIFLNDNIKFNDKNECSELIIETQQKLQNLRLESFIKTFPFTMEEKNNYNYNTNHTDIINTKEKTNKRKLNSDTNIFNQENENNNRKKNSERNYEKISEITKKIKLSDNKDGNNNPNNYVHDSIQCEINSYKNYNSIKNIFEVDKGNKINKILNHQINNNKIKQLGNEPRIDDETSDYKKLESNNNNNDNQCWGILQSINPKFQTFHLKESQLKKEYTIGRSKNCDIQINLPQISGIHCRIYYTENKSNLSGYIIREYFLQDLSSYGTYINEKLVGKGNVVKLFNGQCIDLYKCRKMEKCFIFLIPNQAVLNYPNNDEYIMNDDIGSGSFGTVYKAIRKYDNQEVAVKIVSKKKLVSKPGSNLMKYLEREINILKSVKHKNIIQLYDVYEDSTNVYLVLELANGGELFKRIRSLKKLTENQTRVVMKQLFKALEYLHNRGIAHRDLKPENILMQSTEGNDFSIKLSDFGLSRFVDDNFYMRTQCGTPNYTAPEIFDKNIKNYTIAVDMWSCGVIMYICLCGYTPFSRKNSKYPLKTQIMNGLYVFRPEHWNNVSKEAISLIKSLLQISPDSRITVSQALNHPFIKKENVKMQVDLELKRKRDSQILKDENIYNIIKKENIAMETNLNYVHNKNSNENNKLKRQKLLSNNHHNII